MDFDLSEEQQLLRKSVEDFVRRECPEDLVASCSRSGRHDDDVWRRFAATGWLGVGIDPGHGGSGGTVLDTALIVEASVRAQEAIGPIFPTVCFGGHLLETAGSPEQQRELLPRLAAGELRFALSLTEPGGGTDVLGAMRTTARRTGNGWVISGGKVFTSAAKTADHLMVAARTSPPAGTKRASGVTIFYVDRDVPGVTIDPIDVLSGEDTNIVTYAEVEVGPERVIGEVDRGFYALLAMLNHERIGLGAMCVGWAQAALDEALAYAREREAFGGPIGRFQAVQHHLARMYVLTEQARLLVYRAAWLQSQGRPCGLEATAAKAVAAENAFTACDLGMQVLGGLGYTLESPINRFWRRTRLFRLAPISNEMAFNFVAEQLGMPRSF
jgi:acyl-CoA dehydrogenase